MNSRRMNIPHDAVTLLGTGVMWWDLTVDFVESIEAGPMEDYNRASSVYYLLKGGHVTVVQAPVRQHATLANEDEARYRETLAIIAEEVAILRTLLDTIPLESVDCVYLHQDNRTGNYRLIPAGRTTFVEYNNNFPIWLPLVPEKDIELIKFVDKHIAECIWDGTLVEVYIGWGDQTLQAAVVRATRFFYHSRHLDVTFKALAHITRKGHVVGLIVERTRGRPLEYRDRTLAYDAFATMQENDLFMVVPSNGRPVSDMFLVCDGKFKIRNDDMDVFKHVDWERARQAREDPLPGIPCGSSGIPPGELYNDFELYIIFDELMVHGPSKSPVTPQPFVKFPVLHDDISPEIPFPDCAGSFIRDWIRKIVKTDKFKRTPWVGFWAIEFQPGAEEDIAKVTMAEKQKADKKSVCKSVSRSHPYRDRSSKRTRVLLVAYEDEKAEPESSGSILEVEDDEEVEETVKRMEGKGGKYKEKMAKA